MVYALPAPRQQRIWPWVVLTLALLVNAVVLAAALLLQDRQTAPAAPPVAQAQPPANVQIVIPPTAVLNQAQPQLAPAVVAGAAATEPTVAPAAESQAVPRRSAAYRSERTARRAPVEETPYAALDADSGTRTRAVKRAPVEMPPAEQMEIPARARLPDTAVALAGGFAPELNMDVHVYNDQPGKRFVLINSRRYREGEKLSEGPVVEAITQKGAILRYQGERFLLSVQH